MSSGGKSVSSVIREIVLSNIPFETMLTKREFGTGTRLENDASIERRVLLVDATVTLVDGIVRSQKVVMLSRPWRPLHVVNCSRDCRDAVRGLASYQYTKCRATRP